MTRLFNYFWACLVTPTLFLRYNVRFYPLHLGMFSPFLVFDYKPLFIINCNGKKFSQETYHLTLEKGSWTDSSCIHKSILRTFCLSLHSSVLDIERMVSLLTCKIILRDEGSYKRLFFLNRHKHTLHLHFKGRFLCYFKKFRT